ncbi:TPA: hypothetical protein DIC38_02930 [Candidatus Nomurabacteria bacterium]|nr:MAG: hypothetical protein O210_OD1C00001G0199 [Parcubacteria bacterium RAAC4_OD1_1]HCY26607.1 hypothetical protein [Candidatus Nomurabacteria bacterium]
MKTKILEKEIFIGNIEYLYPQLPIGNELRMHIAALTLTNQKSNVDDVCIPMISGWNENPAVGFADFQWWIKCHIEESNFIIGDAIIPFNKKLSLPAITTHGEPSVVLEFKDGTKFRLTARDKAKPIEVCVRKGSNFIKRKIKEYGYTDLSGD